MAPAIHCTTRTRSKDTTSKLLKKTLSAIAPRNQPSLPWNRTKPGLVRRSRFEGNSSEPKTVFGASRLVRQVLPRSTIGMSTRRPLKRPFPMFGQACRSSMSSPAVAPHARKRFSSNPSKSSAEQDSASDMDHARLGITQRSVAARLARDSQGSRYRDNCPGETAPSEFSARP